jgi:thiol-disulfide isomerase/thioredoxin
MTSLRRIRTTSRTTRPYASQSHRSRIGGTQWLTLALACIVAAWVAIGGLTAYDAHDAAVSNQYSDRLAPDGVLDAIGKTRASGTVPVVIFWGDGCEHCAAEMQTLRKLAKERPSEFMLLGMETWQDDGNAAVRDEVERELGLETGKVPLLIVGSRVFQGYNEDNPNDADIADAIADAYGSADRVRLAMRLLGRERTAAKDDTESGAMASEADDDVTSDQTGSSSDGRH